MPHTWRGAVQRAWEMPAAWARTWCATNLSCDHACMPLNGTPAGHPALEPTRSPAPSAWAACTHTRGRPAVLARCWPPRLPPRPSHPPPCASDSPTISSLGQVRRDRTLVAKLSSSGDLNCFVGARSAKLLCCFLVPWPLGDACDQGTTTPTSSPPWSLMPTRRPPAAGPRAALGSALGASPTSGATPRRRGKACRTGCCRAGWGWARGPRRAPGRTTSHEMGRRPQGRVSPCVIGST